MTASGLGVVGAVVGVCVNYIVLAVSGLSMTLHALIMKKNYPKKANACRFAYTSYQKELKTLKGCLRGKEFNEDTLLFELNRLDDLVIDMRPLISDKLSRKYYKTFKINFPGPSSNMKQAVSPSYRAVSVVHETSI